MYPTGHHNGRFRSFAVRLCLAAGAFWAAHLTGGSAQEAAAVLVLLGIPLPPAAAAPPSAHRG